jgi:hypothetical protein
MANNLGSNQARHGRTKKAAPMGAAFASFKAVL